MHYILLQINANVENFSSSATLGATYTGLFEFCAIQYIIFDFALDCLVSCQLMLTITDVNVNSCSQSTDFMPVMKEQLI